MSAQEHPPVLSPQADAAAYVRTIEAADGPADRRVQLGDVAFNARNNTPWPAPAIDAITVLRFEDGVRHEVLAPFDTTLGWVRFSPDGAYLSYAVIRDTGTEQWVLDIASGTPRPLTSASLNATLGEPCGWLADSRGMLCRFVKPARGSPPAADEGGGDEAPVDYYFTSQLGAVMLATGRRTDIGTPGLYVRALARPDGRYAVARVGQTVELWDQDGTVLREVAVAER